MSVLHLPWPDVQVPEYAFGRHGRWTIGETRGAMPGYFTPEVRAANAIALKRKENGRDITWMSIVPMEKESHMPHIAAARGHVAVMGLGMGMYLYNIIQKPEVRCVTVVERDESVLKLFHAVTKFDNWPGAEKVRFIKADARQWKPDYGSPFGPVDFLYADFWKRMGDRNQLKWTRECLVNVQPVEFGYWTQEFDFLYWRIQNKIPAMDSGKSSYNDFAAYVKNGVKTRMVGEDDPRYALLATIANYIQACTGYRDDPAMVKMMNTVISELITRYVKEYPPQPRGA